MGYGLKALAIAPEPDDTLAGLGVGHTGLIRFRVR